MPQDKNAPRHLIARRKLSNERRDQVFEVLFRMPVTNAKFERQCLEFDFDGACVKLVEELAAKALSQTSGSLAIFLRENPWPNEMEGEDLVLSEHERAKVVVLNAVKQWLSKEALYLDTLFTGGRFRDKLRALSAARNCPNCKRPFAEVEKVEFHHTVRDGRLPVPVCSKCHQTLENQSSIAEPRDSTLDQASVVKRIKKEKHASWENLFKAIKSLQGRAHEPFSTKNVENASKATIRLIMRELIKMGLSDPQRALSDLQRIVAEQIRIQGNR